MPTTYTNTKTGEIFTEDNVIVTSNGVIVKNNSDFSYTFIPQENLSINYDTSALGYSPQLKPSIQHTSTEDLTYRTDLYDKSYSKKVIAYRFGLDNITAGYVAPKDSCGFLSKEISIDSCSYIKLNSTISGEYDSIEYYIVDGNTEAPILPNKEKTVTNELLFSDLPTRFVIDTTLPVSIFLNGRKTDFTVSDLNSLAYDENLLYTINYTPYGDPNRYYPIKNKIRIKIIQRKYTVAVPAIIKSVTIEKYGGVMPWSTLV